MEGKNQSAELIESLSLYENQLKQIELALAAANSGVERDNLINLKNDIEELIQLTKESLGGTNEKTDEDEDPFAKEYALFKAEIAKEENEDQTEREVDGLDPDQTAAVEDLKNELASLQGTKCQAPYKHKWEEGKSSYHNALVMSIEDIEEPTNNIQDIMIRVMFVNPVHKKMVPCPYYLEGDCRFQDDKCHFSHGELISFSDLKEYKEPDFSTIKIGSRVLAKHKDNLWHHATVLELISDDTIKVKFNTSAGGTQEINLHDALPLDSCVSNAEVNYGASTSDVGECSGSNKRAFNYDNTGSESSNSEDDDSCMNNQSNEIDRESIIQLSLLRTPASSALGQWEKHTKGIGSRLMANMGYIAGSGLGKRGEGRLEPVEAVVFPPGKSLDHCMNLREAAGNDPNMFKAEKQRLKMQKIEDKRKEKEQQKANKKVDLFSFINKQLSGSQENGSTEHENSSKQLASSSRKGLNVESFRVSENIKKTEKDLMKIKESLKRHQTGSSVHKHLSNKLLSTEKELDKLQATERTIRNEQNRRDSNKKLVVF